MEILKQLLDYVLHIDKYLQQIIDIFGSWSYIILFAIIFMETGLVVTPFLPGDSLIFTAGALSASGYFNVVILFFVLLVAAIVGDTVNYHIGKYIGEKAFTMNNRFLKKEYLEKAQAFYEKHGGKAIFLSRFVPIVRTFAPFVAGIGNMRYTSFLTYNVTGGLAWVSIFLFGGYALGNIPFIKDNMHYSIFIILFVSVIPIIYEVLKEKYSKKK